MCLTVVLNLSAKLRKEKAVIKGWKIVIVTDDGKLMSPRQKTPLKVGLNEDAEDGKLNARTQNKSYPKGFHIYGGDIKAFSKSVGRTLKEQCEMKLMHRVYAVIPVTFKAKDTLAFGRENYKGSPVDAKKYKCETLMPDVWVVKRFTIPKNYMKYIVR